MSLDWRTISRLTAVSSSEAAASVWAAPAISAISLAELSSSAPMPEPRRATASSPSHSTAAPRSPSCAAATPDQHARDALFDAGGALALAVGGLAHADQRAARLDDRGVQRHRHAPDLVGAGVVQALFEIA